MKQSTKKWLAVAGGLALCAVLVVLITGQFTKEPPQEAPLPATSSQPGDVVVQDPDTSGIPESQTPEKEDEGPVMKPEEIPVSTPSSDAGGGAVSSGAEQTIQADPVKPTPSEEELRDPTQKPDGTPVESTPIPEDHNNVTPPPPPPSTNTGGGLPGFDNVPDAGPNQGEYVDGDGDINKQVGIMG